LYSYEGDNSQTGDEHLVEKIAQIINISGKDDENKDYAKVFASISFADDYGNLSSKAMRKILPFMKEGNEYSLACAYAGYRHSKASLTKEEIENRVLADKLELLPKNSLRNPVVEKT
jgi:CRISPR-associated endonuclease Csn1